MNWKKATYDKLRPDPKPTPKLKEKKKPIGKKPVHSFSQLRDEADEVWSKYVRQSNADERGRVKCCTCPKVLHWKQMHCGHFVDRDQNIIRFDFRNTHPQCEECNVVKRGNREEYEKFIDYTYGKGTAEKLRALARKPFKLERQQLEEIIENCKIINR